MTNLARAKREKISERMIIAGQIYLGTCGALEDSSLVLNRAFAEHMLESTLEESGESYGLISKEMQDRAVEYFSKYREPEDPMAITYSYFVDGLLSYALFGVDPNIINEEDGQTVIRFPSNR